LGVESPVIQACEGSSPEITMVPTARQLQSKMGRGLLPIRFPSIDVRPSPARATFCAGCDRPVTHSQAQFETLELKRDGTPYYFHADCYEAWKSVLKVLIDRASRP
jgi:hypothetical protein